MNIKLWQFLLAYALLITALNFNFFTRAFSQINFKDDAIFALSLLPTFFAIVLPFLCLLLNKLTLKVLCVVFVLIAAFSSYFIQNYGVIIDSEMIRAIFETDTKEVRNLLTAKLVIWVLLLGVLPSILILKTKIIYPNWGVSLSQRFALIVLSLGFIAGIYEVFNKTYTPFFRQNREIRFYALPFYPLYSFHKYIKKSYFTQAEAFQTLADDAIRREAFEKKLMVLVVGETQRAANYSLNGYLKNNTNDFTEDLDVLSFSNFYSCGTATARSLPCMFSYLDYEKFDIKKAQNLQNIVDVVMNAGIKTYWFDNNSGGCKGICQRIPAENQKDYRAQGYDEIIFRDAQNIIANLDESALIVLHLQGAHGPSYYQDYPEDFRRFTPTCDSAELQNCSNEAIENTYDNVILYEDYLLSELIKKLQNKSGFEATMFFVSDHGESLGENGLYLHGMPYALAPDTQKHVPALLWTNCSQKAVLNTLKDAPLSHDNIFNSLLGFFEIQTSIYDKKLDIFYKISDDFGGCFGDEGQDHSLKYNPLFPKTFSWMNLEVTSLKNTIHALTNHHLHAYSQQRRRFCWYDD